MREHLRELYYIADPMCSWCYGFAGVIQGIHAQYQDRMDISLIVGGLRHALAEAGHRAEKQRVPDYPPPCFCIQIRISKIKRITMVKSMDATGRT